MNIRSKPTLIIVSSLIAIWGVIYLKVEHENRLAIQQRAAFESEFQGAYFQLGDEYFQISKSDSMTWKLQHLGWCGNRTSVAENIWTEHLMDMYDPNSQVLVVEGQPYQRMSDDMNIILENRDSGTLKIDAANEWHALGTKLVGPTYEGCQYKASFASAEKSPRILKVTSEAEISQLTDGGYALFPRISVSQPALYGPPLVDGEQRIKIDDVFKPMAVINQVDTTSTIMPINVEDANELLKTLSQKDSVTIGDLNISSKGFTKALSELEKSNPDLVTWRFLETDI